MDRNGSSIERRPILPEPIADRMKGGLSRFAGTAILLLALAGWLSLVSWSNLDPSLTHSAGGRTRNWLGPIGAILSDLMLLTLGLAATFAMVVLTYVGGELIVRGRVPAFRKRLLVAPLAILVLAGALAALPTPPTWALNHGLGGVLGGMVFKLVAGLFALVNPARAGLAAGLVLFAGGMCLLTAALGLTYRDYAILLRPEPPPGPGDGAVRAAGAWRTLLGRAVEGVGGLQDGGPRADRSGRCEPSRGGHPSTVQHTPSPPPPLPPVAGRGSPHPESVALGAGYARGPVGAGAHPGPAAASGPRPPYVPPPGGHAVPPVRRPPPSPRYAPPAVELLAGEAQARSGGDLSETVLRGNARLLEDVLADFGVKGEIKDIRPGPVVTLYELIPARGTKAARVIALADDIARSMSATSARVAVVAGRNAIGIELPNARREDVILREIMESDAFARSEAVLPLALGCSIAGDPVVVDLARMPHLLVAGTTGSGKSVGLNAIILSLLYRLSPRECRLLMIDPKMLELAAYNGIPHLIAPVVTDPGKAAGALEWAVREMEERYKRMAKLGVRNIEMFNERARAAEAGGAPLVRRVQTGIDPHSGAPIVEEERLSTATLPYIVVIVDELADLMAVAGKEIEGAVQRLAQMARAAGIHLILATQRPSVDVITGTIKANFPTRISFKVTSKIDSRTILGEPGAEQLLGKGDMLLAPGNGPLVRVHGPFVSEAEVDQVANYLRAQGIPDYVDLGLGDDEEEDDTDEDADEVYDRAVALVVRERKASPSFLQKRLALSFVGASELLNRMESDGVVGPAGPSGRREVLMA